MPRTFIRAALAVALTLLAFSVGAYAQDSAEREAEWRAYKLPTSNFVRYVDPSRTIMFRVPASWQQQGAEEVTESGALKMSNAAWENSYQLSFAKAGWASLFSRFEAKGLAQAGEVKACQLSVVSCSCSFV